MPIVSGRSYGSNRAPPAGGPGAAPGGAAAGGSAGTRIDQDSFERVVLCMRVLGDPQAASATLPVLLRSCRDTFRGLLAERRARTSQALRDGATVGAGPTIGGVFLAAGAAAGGAGGPPGGAGGEETKGEPAAPRVAAEQVLAIRQLRGAKGGAYGASEDLALDDAADVSKAAGGDVAEDFQARLKRVHQLTGFADPVYAEAYVRVHEYDIVLEMLLINRTDATLTNVTVELSVMGDLKVVERPAPFTLGPRDSKAVKGSIKVASTETGHIFGNIVYGGASGADQTVINLAEIHVDIMDYVVPAVCSDALFRSMWADFEWENKVSINTNIQSLHEFVRHIARMTNMRILTPIEALPPTVSFLAANLYARSVFGEDALVNISVENRPAASIKGHIRIRAKTQGVALSIGDRITAKQRGT
jgi:coatomer subunit beta